MNKKGNQAAFLAVLPAVALLGEQEQGQTAFHAIPIGHHMLCPLAVALLPGDEHLCPE